MGRFPNTRNGAPPGARRCRCCGSYVRRVRRVSGGRVDAMDSKWHSTAPRTGAHVVRLAYGLVVVALVALSVAALLLAPSAGDGGWFGGGGDCGADGTANAPTHAGSRVLAEPPLAPGQGRSILDQPPPPRVPPGLRVAIVTMHVRGDDPRGPNNRTHVVNYADKTADITDLALANIERYSRYHGYDLLVIDRSLDLGRPLAWTKLVALMRYLPDYDWLLYVDGDALFSNFAITIEDRIRAPEGARCDPGPDGELEFFVAAHAVNNTLNSGVMLMKNTPRVMDLLLTIYSNHSRTWMGLQDNRAVVNVLGGPVVPAFVCRLMGDYARWLQSSVHTTSLSMPGNYAPNDWIVHFAGGCAPWCRIAVQLVNMCATYPALPECETALTRTGWKPMTAYGVVLDPDRSARRADHAATAA